MRPFKKLALKKNALRLVSKESTSKPSYSKDSSVANKKSTPKNHLYSQFNILDGSHPWQQAVPEGCVMYPVRSVANAKVIYFNFALAKEMGLISIDHPHHLNTDLEKKLIESFSIQIINEYDQKKMKSSKDSTVSKKSHMATRYLQLQHTDKTGRTSGDGRGIWNGIVKHKGITWDVSSRGTGVTCLSPGAVEANRPLKTGSTDYGYGCGLAEIDELLAAAIMAEIIHLQGINTERVLCVLDHGNGHGIGVRASPNLFRPAHMFLYIKQNRLKELKKSLDFFIDRQVKNERWEINKTKPTYEWMLENIAKDFARFAAKLEVEYIFAWLDWDGDNVLADAGIIDYGSIRQFGSCHNQYRYDDVQRFSTSLKEQKDKAKATVQVFAQIVECLRKNKKIPMAKFKSHPAIKLFEQQYQLELNNCILYRVGFNQAQRSILLKYPKLVSAFILEYQFLENLKVLAKPQKVPDGINHFPLLNIRKILAYLPEFFINTDLDQRLLSTDFYSRSVTQFAKAKDRYQIQKIHNHIKAFQDHYAKMLKIILSHTKNQTNTLNELQFNAKKLNADFRMTGNALIETVDLILTEFKHKKIDHLSVQETIDHVIRMYLDQPEIMAAKYYDRKPKLVKNYALHEAIMRILIEKSEDI